MVLVDEVGKTHLEALLSARLANGAHGGLHSGLKLDKPVLNITLALDWVVKVDGFGRATPVLVDGTDKSAVDLIECNSANSIEHFLEIILDLVRISTNGQNLEEIRVRAEVETWEHTSLLLKVSLELTLAVFEVLLHLWESGEQQIILAAWDDELLLGDTLHDLLPLSVNVLEDLGLLRHLLGDLTTSED